jgi:hypothetical protein
MLTEETNREDNTTPTTPEAGAASEELSPEEAGKGSWREAFRTAFDRARRQQKPESRRELGRDKSKSLFLLVGACVAVLLLFFGVFSHPKQKIALPGENPRGEASLGRKVTPGQENIDPSKAATPMLSADVRSADPALAGQLTPEDIGRTSRSGMPPKPAAATQASTKPPQDYALSKVDFSDPSVGQSTTATNSASTPSESASDLKKPSLVFVRATDLKPALKPNFQEVTEETLALAAGTRLVARLQTPVSSAVSTPVVAVGQGTVAIQLNFIRPISTLRQLLRPQQQHRCNECRLYLGHLVFRRTEIYNAKQTACQPFAGTSSGYVGR